MRDLNPLYSAVLQAVEAMAPSEQPPMPDDMTPDEHAHQTQPYTESQLRLHRLLNGDFQPTAEPADTDPIAQRASERQ
ncbi:hypothetical protein ALQ33_03922 [Pseudomonas syringae pv. philadelphi]|uniref:Uncharacterized protein n=1 Tax=Pseudomonas syringae pv. philadelphi TaxID=251706 RepID=A0A3M3YNI8_9PSED|nr:MULTISPECIES: hypothetical protein [Pseudomonas syringae group]RMO84062.1 hypothetical protein ALQ33_03922 [Pseudomonas syringae pv. philadelphi]SDX09524.1 hypothetical protein SAMN05444514_111118 [Pseudomonas syringae]SFM27225.1 hypothetical protein SAMN05444064_112118 [Pseudomonas syringae]